MFFSQLEPLTFPFFFHDHFLFHNLHYATTRFLSQYLLMPQCKIYESPFNPHNSSFSTVRESWTTILAINKQAKVLLQNWLSYSRQIGHIWKILDRSSHCKCRLFFGSHISKIDTFFRMSMYLLPKWCVYTNSSWMIYSPLVSSHIS